MTDSSRFRTRHGELWDRISLALDLYHLIITIIIIALYIYTYTLKESMFLYLTIQSEGRKGDFDDLLFILIWHWLIGLGPLKQVATSKHRGSCSIPEVNYWKSL